MCLRKKNASEISRGGFDVIDNAFYNRSSEIGILDLTRNTVDVFPDERLKDCYLYKIPKTTSFLAFKQTITDNSVIYDERLYTNYSINSGSFRIQT
jgi:hypothetical protein